MFIALKLCSTELERAAATFKTARDQAQVLHLLVDRKGSKTCLENVHFRPGPGTDLTTGSADSHRS